jgi:hypothetical protein
LMERGCLVVDNATVLLWASTMVVADGASVEGGYDG